ncbi:MAG: SURF1 family protein [Pseudomonadota bacterium]
MTAVLRSPRFWVVTIAAVLVAALTFSLGQWQLRRAAQKEALQTAIASQSGHALADAVALLAVTPPEDAIHRPATLRGSWQAAHTVFLDNRPMSGKTGFIVVTPLALEGTSKVILVQRGWVQRDFTDRNRLPDVPTPAGVVTVPGRIAPPPSKLYEFKGVEAGRIRQNMDLQAFAAESGLPLMGVSLLQTGASSEGLLRDWAPPNLGIEKHYGYAFQWFALCALVVMLYLWFQILSPLRRMRRQKSTHRDPSDS